MGAFYSQSVILRLTQASTTATGAHNKLQKTNMNFFKKPDRVKQNCGFFGSFLCHSHSHSHTLSDLHTLFVVSTRRPGSASSLVLGFIPCPLLHPLSSASSVEHVGDVAVLQWFLQPTPRHSLTEKERWRSVLCECEGDWNFNRTIHGKGKKLLFLAL